MVISATTEKKTAYSGASGIEVDRFEHMIFARFIDHRGEKTGELRMVISEALDLYERVGRALGMNPHVRATAVSLETR